MKRSACHLSPGPHLIIAKNNLHSTFIDYTPTIRHASMYFFFNWPLLFNVLVPVSTTMYLHICLKKKGRNEVLGLSCRFAWLSSVHVCQCQINGWDSQEPGMVVHCSVTGATVKGTHHVSLSKLLLLAIDNNQQHRKRHCCRNFSTDKQVRNVFQRAMRIKYSLVHFERTSLWKLSRLHPTGYETFF